MLCRYPKHKAFFDAAIGYLLSNGLLFCYFHIGVSVAFTIATLRNNANNCFTYRAFLAYYTCVLFSHTSSFTSLLSGRGAGITRFQTPNCHLPAFASNGCPYFTSFNAFLSTPLARASHSYKAFITGKRSEGAEILLKSATKFTSLLLQALLELMCGISEFPLNMYP